MWQGAQCLLLEVMEFTMRLDLVSYSTVSSACDKGCAWQPTLQLLQDLRPRFLEVDAVMYSTFVAPSLVAQAYS